MAALASLPPDQPDAPLSRHAFINASMDEEAQPLLASPVKGAQSDATSAEPRLPPKKPLKPLPTIQSNKLILRFLWIALAFVLAAVIFGVDQILPDEPAARRALALFVFISMLWATEAMPIFITSLLVPILVVWLRILINPATNTPYDAYDAAKAVAGAMFSNTVMVAMGAFTMSLALTKYQLSYRLAVIVLSRIGKNPAVVMIVVMLLAEFLSMWVTNVAAPVVCVAVIRPMLDDIPAREVYGKVILLGIAYASNIAGSITPIASPQTLVTVQVVQNTQWTNPSTNRTITGDLGWGPLMGVGIPFSTLCVFIAWGILWLWYRPKIKQVNPVPDMPLHPITWVHFVVLFVCTGTILLWAINNETIDFTGQIGVTALIPVVIFFGFGILEPKDFKHLSWDVLMLLAGGLTLGTAIQSSNLLAIMAQHAANALRGHSTWVVLLGFSAFIWLFSNFISHTVSAIIVMPIIASVGCELGNGDCSAGHYALLVVGCLYMDCCAMSLPVTSFPNAQCYSVQDRSKVPYLRTVDFILTGVVVGLAIFALNMTVAYGLLLKLGF